MLAEFAVKAPLSRRLLRCFAFLCGLGLLFGLDLLHAPMCHNHNHSHIHGHDHYHQDEPQGDTRAAAAAFTLEGMGLQQQPHHHHLHDHPPEEAHAVSNSLRGSPPPSTR